MIREWWTRDSVAVPPFRRTPRSISIAITTPPLDVEPTRAICPSYRFRRPITSSGPGYGREGTMQAHCSMSCLCEPKRVLAGSGTSPAVKVMELWYDVAKSSGYRLVILLIRPSAMKVSYPVMLLVTLLFRVCFSTHADVSCRSDHQLLGEAVMLLYSHRCALQHDNP